LVFWGSISPPEDADDLKSQLRGSREKMLALTFDDFEREVRTVLHGLLGPAGFDVTEDILAITVNRWPHGYSYEYMQLWDPVRDKSRVHPGGICLAERPSRRRQRTEFNHESLP